MTSAMTSLGDGLIARYPLNGTADDTSGNGNHGIATNVNWIAGS